MARRSGFEPDGCRGENGAIQEDARGLKRERGQGRRNESGASRHRGELVTIDRTVDRDERDKRSAVAIEPGGANSRPGRLLDARGKLLELTLRPRGA